MVSKKILQALADDSNPRALIEELVACLPGPLTSQLMDGTDTSVYNWNNFSESCYGKLLYEILQHMKMDWLRKDGFSQSLEKLFIIESGSEIMLYESLFALDKGMKSCQGPSVILDFILDVLKNVLLSDFLISATVSVCKQAVENESIVSTYMTSWEDSVQLLVSFPSRVANKTKGNIDRCFIPDIYIKIILVHIAKCVVYLSKLRDNMVLNLKPLSLLLSRFITNFKVSPSFHTFFQVMHSWSNERNDEFSVTLCEVLKRMETTSIEITALLILKSCSEESLLRVMKPDFLEISSWKYSLCQKIPLLTFYTDPKVSTNLITFLGNVSVLTCDKENVDVSSRSALPNLMIQLLSVWADKSAMQHTSQEQHLYISKLIVLGFNYLCNFVSLPGSLINTLQTKLFQGMPTHLDNTTESIRVMGMITAECVVSHLNKLQEKDGKGGLQFDFSSVKNENKGIISDIRSMSEFKFKNKETTNLPKGDDLLDEMIMEIKKESFAVSEASKASRSNQFVSQVNEIKANPYETSIEDKSDLDSDDDLVPYDLTNDVKISLTKRPKYLRDLIEGLREENDIDIWIGSLEVCEGLIYKQLPDDDVTLGLDLLDILLCLEKKSCCENFDSLRFSSAVAILVIFPDAGAQYICQQFHQDVGKYSIAQRMLMLDVLSAAAKILSTPESSSYKESRVDLPSRIRSEPDWHIIVRTRVEKHTRKFAQPKKFKVETKNRFANVAGSFFFPLIRGSGKTTPGIIYSGGHQKCTQEESCVLLVHFLKTCGLVVTCSVNSTASTKMGKELLEATWSFRFNPEARVREAVIGCLAAVVLAVPPSRLLSELFEELIEARLWLDDVVNSYGIVGGHNCEVDENCRTFAAQVSLLIGNALSK